MKTPKITVGLPVYNGERFLRFALKSLREQEFEDFEVIICDNASTDGTAEICREYACRDCRIRYQRNEKNLGLGPNHNRVLHLARAELFKWAAHDDEYPRQMLRRFVEAFDAAPAQVTVIYSQCEVIDAAGKAMGTASDNVQTRNRWPHRRLARLLNEASIYNFAYGVIKTDALRRTRLHGSYPFADRVLFAELAMLGELVEIPEPLLRLRFHPGRTFQARTDSPSLRKLFDSDNRGSILTLEGRAQLELMYSAFHTPSGFCDKLMCLWVALSVPYWRRLRTFAGRRKQTIRRGLQQQDTPVPV